MFVNGGGQRHDRTALVLYGSETGNSQDVAEDLGRMMERLRFKTQVREMETVQLEELLDLTVALCVVPTTGQGEFPRNARKLWRSLLLKRLPPNLFEGLSFTVFGLGDSSYAQFNWAARKLQKRLEQLGAKEIYPRGEADEQHDEGYDGAFLPWKVDLRKNLLSLYPLPAGVSELPPDVLLLPKIRLKLGDNPSPQKMGVPLTTESTETRTSQDRDLVVAKEVNQQNMASSSSSYTSSTEASINNHSPVQPQPPYSTREAMDDAISLNESTLLWTPSATQSQPDGRSQLKEASDEPSADVHFYTPLAHALPIPNGIDAKLQESRRITPENHWQDVRLLTFHIPSGVPFGAGCALKIWPKNFPEDVQSLIELQGWNLIADITISFETLALLQYSTSALAHEVPGLYPAQPFTLRNLLTHNLDFNAIPKRHFFEIIANFTDDETHRQRLLDFANPFYSEEFFDYTSRPRRSILEILQDFPSVKLPWTDILHILPVIKPRSYSLASCGTQGATDSNLLSKIDILVAIVKYRTILKKVRQGLCSRYLAELQPGTYIRGKLEWNEKFLKVLNPSAHPERPALMIAPGTGIAPCRALLWERASHKFMQDIDVGKNVLIFGNRNKNADFFFEDELRGGFLDVTVCTAFSRDQKEKIYVQDVINKEGKLVYELLRDKAVVYVCGSSGNMPKAVKSALVEVMMRFGGPTGRNFTDPIRVRKECEDWMKSMEKNCEYIQETW